MLVPLSAEAWGPYTHLYLGQQLISSGMYIVPAGVYALIKEHKGDFLYGNLSADIILGKRFQRLEKNSHSWGVAWKLFKAANTKPQKAFAYGYLAHLSADTVIHNIDKASFPFKHSFLEIKSDSLIEGKYKKILKEIDKSVQKRNDIFLEHVLDSGVFSFRTNRRIFKGFLFLSRVHNYKPVSDFIDKRFSTKIPAADIHNFHQESLDRMFELLRNGKNSKMLHKTPLRKYRGRYKGKLFQLGRKPFR
jgi:hypothetical protein